MNNLNELKSFKKLIETQKLNSKKSYKITINGKVYPKVSVSAIQGIVDSYKAQEANV